MSKQDKYTRSARGKDCTIRIPGHCKPAPDNETTVLCHVNGGGMASKHHNMHGAYGCNVCHDIVDGRHPVREFSHDDIKLMHLEGVIRTQIIMIDEGILKV